MVLEQRWRGRSRDGLVKQDPTTGTGIRDAVPRSREQIKMATKRIRGRADINLEQ
jgi:hypothetical protein